MKPHAAGQLALLCWLIGAVVLATTWWDAGEQTTSATQLPAVLVAFGGGLGLLVLGAALWAIDRARTRQLRGSLLLLRVLANAEVGA